MPLHKHSCESAFDCANHRITEFPANLSNTLGGKCTDLPRGDAICCISEFSFVVIPESLTFCFPPFCAGTRVFGFLLLAPLKDSASRPLARLDAD